MSQSDCHHCRASTRLGIQIVLLVGDVVHYHGIAGKKFLRLSCFEYNQGGR